MSPKNRNGLRKEGKSLPVFSGGEKNGLVVRHFGVQQFVKIQGPGGNFGRLDEV